MKLDPALEGKLIHAWAFADTEEILKDDLFGIQLKAVQLSRNVEFFQREESSETETRKKLGGGEVPLTMPQRKYFYSLGFPYYRNGFNYIRFKYSFCSVVNDFRCNSFLGRHSRSWCRNFRVHFRICVVVDRYRCCLASLQAFNCGRNDRCGISFDIFTQV